LKSSQGSFGKLSHDQISPDAAVDLSWLGCRNGGFQKLPKEALKKASHGQSSPDAAMALNWLGRRNGGYSESP
jgi:hypothetical protein